MLEDIFENFYEYLRENKGIYIFISTLFIFGILGGALVVRWLDSEILEGLNNHFAIFLEGMRYENGIDHTILLKESLIKNVTQVALIWLAGIFIFGFPVIGFIMAARGFSIGFTVAFLVDRGAFSGILFSLGSVLPHNLLLVPAFLTVSVTGFSLSYFNFKDHYILKKSYSIGKQLGPYSMMIALTCAVILVGCLLQTYLSMFFMRLLLSLMP